MGISNLNSFRDWVLVLLAIFGLASGVIGGLLLCGYEIMSWVWYVTCIVVYQIVFWWWNSVEIKHAKHYDGDDF